MYIYIYASIIYIYIYLDICRPSVNLPMFKEVLEKTYFLLIAYWARSWTWRKLTELIGLHLVFIRKKPASMPIFVPHNTIAAAYSHMFRWPHLFSVESTPFLIVNHLILKKHTSRFVAIHIRKSTTTLGAEQRFQLILHHHRWQEQHISGHRRALRAICTGRWTMASWDHGCWIAFNGFQVVRIC